MHHVAHTITVDSLNLFKSVINTNQCKEEMKAVLFTHYNNKNDTCLNEIFIR